ncbi:MAG: AAA family ATPase [Nitrospirota bacterium]
MNIKNVHLKNFRCFESLDIPFEKFTTLVGENGSGKTAVLEAINLALSPSFVAARIDEQDFNNHDAGDILIKVIFDEEFTAKLPDGYTAQDVPCRGIELQVKRRDKAAPGKALSEEFVIAHYVLPSDSVPKTQAGWSLTRKSGSAFNFTSRQLTFPVDLDKLPRCFYFDKNRENQSKIGFNSTLQKIAQEYDWRYRKSLEGNKDDLLAKWDEVYGIIIGNVDEKKLKDTFEPVRSKLVSFLDRRYENLELSILNLEQPFQKSFFALRNGLNQIDQKNLGSGISMVLSYFLLETISSLAKEQLIILIDEPEMHLHPQLQYKLRQHLRNSHSQIIASTHSEALIDLGEWRSIKRFDTTQRCYPTEDKLRTTLSYKGKSKRIEEHLDEVKQFYQDKTIFFRENNEMLFARGCLLVEGPAEKYGILVLSQKEGVDISDITIISCNGKDKIPHYEIICTAFEIPFFTLFDKDDKNDTDPSNATIIEWSGKNHYFGFSQSIEHLFGTHKSEHKAAATMLTIDGCTIIPQEIKEALRKINIFRNSLSKSD